MVFTAVLLIAAGTVSAQEKKKVETKVTVVTIDDKGVKKDTTIVTSDTIDMNVNEFVFQTEDGKVIHGTGEGNKMIIVSKGPGAPGAPMTPGMAPGMAHMMVRNFDEELGDGVTYRITIDGVTVSINAPGDKMKEADLIMSEVKKILIKK